MNQSVKAVTFDLWDTVFADDSDEPKREAQGLPAKPEQRRKLVYDFLSKHAPISKEIVDAAYSVQDAAFSRVWHHQYVTWTVEQRLSVLLQGLGRSLPQDEMAELVRLHEEMEVEIQPNIAAAIGPALETLSAKYKLGVISDTIFSPGRCLKKILESNGLLKHFSTFTFSDEVGIAKPTPGIFEAAAQALKVAPAEIVHIGDREQNDIDGPHKVGARAVLTTVIKDRRQGKDTQAEAICSDYTQLVEIIDQLNQA
jgi:putative hydrolase of the HAD superfamily